MPEGRVESQLTDDQLRLLFRLTQSMSRAKDLSAALVQALETLCRALNWRQGEAWFIHAGHRLERGPHWNLLTGSGGTAAGPTHDLASLALFSGQPAWGTLPTLEAGAPASQAVAIPILASQEPV